MAINRTQELKQLEPGLNVIFGQGYNGFENEHTVLFDSETSSRAFEEELLFPGLGAAPVKPEGAGVTYDSTGEGWVARYNHETIALAFALTEEAMEDNLYEPLATRLTKALARSMAHTKQPKAANVYNNAFSSSFTGGDGKQLCATDHALRGGGTAANEPTVAVDLSETSLENAIIDIGGFVDDRNIQIAVMAKTLHLPRQLEFIAERLLVSPGRVDTANNDINAFKSLGKMPGGYFVNHRFTDPDAWFIRTDAPNGLKFFTRAAVNTKMEGDFESGNVRYKARERYSFGWSDWRALYGSPGA
jgi:hypothetical protein